ncbi:hypothetical protein WJX84_010165 [Apatococcus fuscideae]|uniref:glutaminase n=1 Tax=Apatococcus fuscideae TaxID=2026836 RepID=A0AAW1TGM4_9CHLO
MVDAQRPIPILAVNIGVLALQGSFREHIALLRRLPGVNASEVRNRQQLLASDGLIIPGGESTTMANIAERWGLIPDLQQFAQAENPLWGTCAGLIFLANRAVGQKVGGQALLGGLDCLVHRNFFGAQIRSFEALMPMPPCFADASNAPFRAVFIRAPAILESGPGVEVLSTYELDADEQQQAKGQKSVAVAVRAGNLMATAFHPELTDDVRWHAVFVALVRERLATRQHSATSVEQGVEATAEAETGSRLAPVWQRNRPADLPVFRSASSFAAAEINVGQTSRLPPTFERSLLPFASVVLRSMRRPALRQSETDQQQASSLNIQLLPP